MADTTKPEIVQLLRRINEGVTNSQTPLGEVLRLCLRLGSLLNNKELSDWAKVEAGGYKSTDDLPDYRIFATGVRGTFLGPFCSGYRARERLRHKRVIIRSCSQQCGYLL